LAGKVRDGKGTKKLRTGLFNTERERGKEKEGRRAEIVKSNEDRVLRMDHAYWGHQGYTREITRSSEKETRAVKS